MASVLAGAVVKKVCEMAIQQAANEVNIVYNFTEDFEWLQSRFMEINAVLNEADEESSSQKESVKNWLHRVRDVAWEAEDMLEEFAVESLYARNQFCCLSYSQLILRHKMGRRIQKVKARLSSVVADGNQLNIVLNTARAAAPHVDEAESSSRSEGQQFKRWSRLPSDSKPVGVQSKIESIDNWLENPEIPIIAVVGMGGLGKTYLLQHVYNSRKGRYEKSAWISVSQFYSVPKLQRDLAFQLDENLCKKINESGISEGLAGELIHDFILEKRCLIVLDDVWRASREGALLNRLGIPSSGNSHCKILVSTRNREVAANLKAEIYEMERLTDEESWRLFCAHAFPKSEENRAPESLEEVAHKIVKKCGELPLAIKITAASLASTESLTDWQSKLSMLEKVGTSDDYVMDILKLSYNSLPAHLKACFAYFSFFPEDEQIECDYLMYLWKGEGFIPEGKSPRDCLDQLAKLCLLEVWEHHELWDYVYRRSYLNKHCKIHDLLLDLAILVSSENKCAFSLEDAFSKLHSVNAGGGSWCRLFLAKKGIDEHAISQRRPVFPTHVRTLSLSWNAQIGGKILAMLFSGMRVLRVLDLSHTNITTLPACVGEMKLLKVLNLRNTEIRKVPKCVRSLKSLCYLNLSECRQFRQRQAPKWISELRCLQHLEGPFRRLPKGMSKLESLRTLRTWNLPLYLSRITCMECDVLRLEDVGKMKAIEEIAFYVEDVSQLKRMEEGILAPLEKMRRLYVCNVINGIRGESELHLPQFPERMNAMRDLEHLELDHFAVPSWICCFAKIRCLCLLSCHCSNYPELQAMPNLVTLTLYFNRSCRELPGAFGKSGGFPQLRFLEMSEFPELEEFPEMEDGAMACLEKLAIIECSKVNKVGEGLERLKRLEEIYLYGSGMHQVREMLQEGGTYRKKIKDSNPQITIYI